MSTGEWEEILLDEIKKNEIERFDDMKSMGNLTDEENTTYQSWVRILYIQYSSHYLGAYCEVRTVVQCLLDV